ncbi:MAG: hypothetical protein ACD_34C00112G0002 [uncultured bacterium]|nr:MAG: hypothetical protein ACD_34C00112G0002 [uncultured bacterium]
MLKRINNQKSIVLFEHSPVRRIWVEAEEKWYFSVVDVVGILADSANPNNYWKVLKNRLNNEGSQVVTKCNQLKLMAKDGKKYLTDVADVESMLRIIQSIPSKKAEPFKQWLARVGYERLQETVDPEQALNRARQHWKDLGHPEKWIEKRMLGQETRNKLTDYWQDHDVKEKLEYAKLTNIIHKEWTGLTTGEHKQLKKLKHENLRDHMTDAELIFTALAELSTRQIAEQDQADGFNQNALSAHKGGTVAGKARQLLERQTGKRVVSDENFTLPDKPKRRLPKGKAK